MSCDHMDEIETLQAMKGLAKSVYTFYAALKEEGFSGSEALILTGEWVRGLSTQAGK